MHIYLLANVFLSCYLFALIFQVQRDASRMQTKERTLVRRRHRRTPAPARALERYAAGTKPQ